MNKIYIDKVTPLAEYDGFAWSYIVHAKLNNGTTIDLLDEIPIGFESYIGKWIEVVCSAPFVKDMEFVSENEIGWALKGEVQEDIGNHDFYFMSNGLKIKISKFDSVFIKTNCVTTLFFPEIVIQKLIG